MNWYYQTTPGDNWDYTAVQDMMLAEIEIDGGKRKVQQAPKMVSFMFWIEKVVSS